jgi:hypothetical protein
MADIAASVLARLKNKAAESGRSYQLCLQLFCQEEFLRRLEQSKYAENLVLKGGLFIYSITDFDSRVKINAYFCNANDIHPASTSSYLTQRLRRCLPMSQAVLLPTCSGSF